MHCYVPNFEEVEEANWFGPVSLSVHLPSPLPIFIFFLGGGGVGGMARVSDFFLQRIQIFGGGGGG